MEKTAGCDHRRGGRRGGSAASFQHCSMADRETENRREAAVRSAIRATDHRSPFSCSADPTSDRPTEAVDLLLPSIASVSHSVDRKPLHGLPRGKRAPAVLRMRRSLVLRRSDRQGREAARLLRVHLFVRFAHRLFVSLFRAEFKIWCAAEAESNNPLNQFICLHNIVDIKSVNN